VQRSDLNPLEEAAGYQMLASEYEHSHDQIAKLVGKSRAHVTNTMRLLKLPEPVKAYIREGKISAGAARSLIGSPDPERIAREIVQRGLNVRQAEALAKERTPASAGPKTAQQKHADTLALERSLSDQLGLKVKLTQRGTGGVLAIEFRSLDQLDDLLRRLQGS
jgi:ParB family chromosome partitioning protein